MSIREIRAVTGVAQGTVSAWLSKYPLKKKELRERSSGAQLKAAATRRAAAPQAEESRLHKMLDPEAAKDRSQKAKIAEAAVLLRLVVNGFNVYSSIFDGDRVDMVAEARGGGRLLRVQVKWARKAKHGRPGASLHRTYGHGKQRRYETGAFDVLVAYDLYTDTACVWLATEVDQHSAWVSMSSDTEERWDKLRC